MGVESQSDVEEQPIPNHEGHHSQNINPHVHSSCAQVLQHRLRVHSEDPDCLLKAPVLVLEKHFVGVLENGDVVHPDPVLWYASPAHDNQTSIQSHRIEQPPVGVTQQRTDGFGSFGSGIFWEILSKNSSWVSFWVILKFTLWLLIYGESAGQIM